MGTSIDDLINYLPAKGIEFFVFFSRFEYALKRGGFLKSARWSAPQQNAKNLYLASPDWKAFARCLGPAFLNEMRNSGKMDTFLHTPPKTQVSKENRLAWKKENAIETVSDLFLAVGRLRNNLFHGGKFPSGPLPVGNPDRDDRLIAEAMVILNMALERQAGVKRAFFDYSIEASNPR
ncbi:MAG: hypothetical protein ACREQX_09100 [Candidatus Binataceae bacterium]